jgi:hypothetical protein
MDFMLHAYNFKSVLTAIESDGIKVVHTTCKEYKHEVTPEECGGSISKYH